MANLEIFDQSMRKSRRNSMIMLRAASQLNLAASEDGDAAERKSMIEGLLGDHPHENKVQPLQPGEPHTSHAHEHVKTTAKEAMVMSVSAIYGKLLVVIGIGFPIAKTLSPDLPLIYYNSFYLYLYFGSIIFIIYAYVSLLSSFQMQIHTLVMYFRDFQEYVKPFVASISHYFHQVLQEPGTPKRKQVLDESEESNKSDTSNSTGSVRSAVQMEEGDREGEGESSAHPKSKFVFTENAGHGSMYLKMGTIIFGIGSMIYSGLEFGYYFELRADCSDILIAITPAARMVFTFLQMYFIFLNSRVSISRHTIIARFGIMHMVATNLCIWLNVLVEETKHTIHHVSHMQHDDHHSEHSEDHGSHDDHKSSHDSHGSSSGDLGDVLLNDSPLFALNSTAVTPTPQFLMLTEGLFKASTDAHHIVKRASDEMGECKIVNLMGNMVNTAAPLLFPCTIEYSLLCASVLYVMWRNVRVGKRKPYSSDDASELSQFIARKVRHLYSVDCGRASRGLFSGIFVLVLTLISLILFYVLVSNPDFKYFGILSANVSEILIYSVGTVATVAGMLQLRKLGFIEEEETELDNVLLVVALSGVYMFNIFTLIGGYFSNESMSAFILMTALLTLIQATFQTLYILDGSRRCCRTPEQLEHKPGREIVTFLLMLNLSMWLFSTFQTSRAYLHKAQQDFYGVWAWTIINHVSMPLGIFYRFHATVCLGEIWKRAYKLKSEE